MCPLTPSQHPTNVQHLVVNNAPFSLILNLNNVNSVANTKKLCNARNSTQPQECNQINTNGAQGSSTDLLSKLNANIDSSGYCGIM